MNIAEELKPYRKIAWKPIVADNDGTLLNSKFAGTPFLKQDEEHPLCPNCNKPLQLFLQLNFEELPLSVRGEFGNGIMQLFYCISEEPLCEVECQAWSPFSRSVLTRIVESENIFPPFKKDLIESKFPPKVITGWEQADDYCNWEEGESLNIDLPEDVWNEISEADYPKSGDKLAGYPMWVQGVEYPSCPVCDKQMRLLFQIDSEDNLPFMFGDVGCGHITQCKTHRKQLAFGWACS